MSTTQSSYGTCRYCSSDRTPANAVDQFCSLACKHRDLGAKALRNIEHDHRFCSSCYKPLNVVFRPADRESPKLRKKALVIRESFIGFQDVTEFAQIGNYGLECECGNCQHNHAERMPRGVKTYEV